MLQGLKRIPHVAMKRMADRMIFGLQKHPARGYEHGQSVRTYCERLERYRKQYRAGCTNEDPWAAVICNIAFLMFRESTQSHEGK